jgi:hypothetical protein
MSASATVMESDLPAVVTILVFVCWGAFAWLRRVC